MANNRVLKCVTHGRRVLSLAEKYGWLPGARYTYGRELQAFKQVGFIDIDMKNYNFVRHLEVVKHYRPFLTVAQDVEDYRMLPSVLEQADQLALHSKYVIVVPKDVALAETLDSQIPAEFILGYSVPTRYGGTRISPNRFRRRVHLLGGRPDIQRQLADLMPVVSVDCNRFTLDARYGDYFDGQKFRPHPEGGYERCLESSLKEISKMWSSYLVPEGYGIGY